MNKKTTVKELAGLINGEIRGDGEKVISGISTLIDASPDDLSFLGNKIYKSEVKTTRAAAVIVDKGYDEEPVEGQSLIICDDPNTAFSKIVEFFAPEPIKFSPGIHPSAVVADTAVIGENVHIAPNAVIGEYAEIGNNTVIGDGTSIGCYTKIGESCLLYANVSIRERCVIGNRVIIHPGAVIGSDGYGYAPAPDGMGMVKVPQVGIVQLDDEVEIGANSTIDRARFGKTWLKFRVKVDNLVHIAHNVTVGECSMLVGQCGIAGSASLGQGVVVGAQGGINGHIKIGDGVKVAATSAVAKSVAPGKVMAGTPAEEQRDFMERYTASKKVKRLAAKIKELEEQLSALQRTQ